MKFLPSQLAYLLTERELRTNLGSLLRYLLFLAVLVVAYALLFHVIMERAEGQQHSWITGFYWTLVVMTTLGFGDITFTTDIGRLFSIVVLLSGVVLLLVMLPFLFIRLFYAPWLEARMRMRAPREVAAGVRDHLVFAEYDAIAIGLIRRLQTAGLPYVVIEPDAAAAAQLAGDGVAVVTGDVDSAETYAAAGTERARLLVANREDTTNSNITLTAREVAPDVPIAAIAEADDAVDVLSLSGATHVLPLKRQLGEYLAHRVDVGRAGAHVVGEYRDLVVAELPVRHTPFAGRAVRETHLRETAGLSVAGIWLRGGLQPAYPETRIDPAGVLVVAGTRAQLDGLNRRLAGDAAPDDGAVVLMIGAGRVGQAAAAELRRLGVRTHVLEKDARALAALAGSADLLVEGDAADRATLERAGLATVSTVVLTTNDDAMNIYLAVYCRRLKPDLRIVSRITHERNVEAIHRAGADVVLSYASLGAESLFALIRGRETVILGEGVALFSRDLPAELAGRTLQQSAIGARTGLVVIAVQDGDRFVTQLHSGTVLPAGAELVMIGNLDQRRKFSDAFGRA
ncbi:MAG: TrkA family potassium uptake protein [Vicinamibacterales bacterium]